MFFNLSKPSTTITYGTIVGSLKCTVKFKLYSKYRVKIYNKIETRRVVTCYISLGSRKVQSVAICYPSESFSIVKGMKRSLKLALRKLEIQDRKRVAGLVMLHTVPYSFTFLHDLLLKYLEDAAHFEHLVVPCE